MLNLKYVMNINKFLKNANVLQIGTGFCCIITKPENCFDETETMKKTVITKQTHAFKNHAHACNVEILNSFNSCNSKILDLQLKINQKFF